MNLDYFKSQKYITNNLFVKKAIALKLSLEEFIMLTYFDNDYNSYLNMDELSKNIGLSSEKAYETFTNLLSKKLIDVKTEKDIEGRMIEKVCLDNFYTMIVEEKQNIIKEEKKTDIYAEFEKEFARPITSMEYEIIGAWLDGNYDENIIKLALKEAIYNGVSNLRYIDKILSEWRKKGIKTEKDIKAERERHTKQKPKKEVFEYDWLNEND